MVRAVANGSAGYGKGNDEAAQDRDSEADQVIDDLSSHLVLLSFRGIVASNWRERPLSRVPA
jgi:hypothetical protein